MSRQHRQHGCRLVPRGALAAATRHFAMATAVLATLLGAATAVAGDFRISELEQEVRELRGQLREQRDRIDRLERALARAAIPRAEVPDRPAEPPTELSPPKWLAAARWDQVRTGMSEIEVIEILGPPTSHRDGGRQMRRLFYALEIGRDAFLAGHVDLVDQRVSDIQPPRLR